MTTLKNGYVLDGMNEFERNMKRIFDFCWAAVCLVVFSPLFLICYIAIKREDGGKAIFRYEGKDYSMKWTLDGTTLHAEGGGADLDGTLSA